MQRVIRFLRSMTFGVILLVIIMGISVAGSLIAQNNEPMYYVRTYPETYSWILRLKLDRVFTSWYFAAVVALLCVNLTLCSIVRFRKINIAEQLRTGLLATADVRLTGEGLEKLHAEMKRIHCKSVSEEGKTLYHKNALGYYGTFLIHLGILLSVIFFALGMALPKVMDETCLPGEALTLEDGTEIYVENFSIEDETGKLDYKSRLSITLPGGKTTGIRELSVNHPVGIGSYKVYQQTYGTIGRVSVRDESGHEDWFYVESQDFLSADGRTGILIDNLYPGFNEDEGGIQMVTSTSGRYENPVYVFVLMDGTTQEAMLAFPGDSIEVGGLSFTFEQPVEYPGLRIKKSPPFVNELLLASVLLLTFGLAVTFLIPPILVCVTQDGYRVLGSRGEGMRIKLKVLLSPYEIKEAAKTEEDEEIQEGMTTEQKGEP